jgi:hypothetical protein
VFSRVGSGRLVWRRGYRWCAATDVTLLSAERRCRGAAPAHMEKLVKSVKVLGVITALAAGLLTLNAVHAAPAWADGFDQGDVPFLIASLGQVGTCASAADRSAGKLILQGCNPLNPYEQWESDGSVLYNVGAEQYATAVGGLGASVVISSNQPPEDQNWNYTGLPALQIEFQGGQGCWSYSGAEVILEACQGSSGQQWEVRLPS